MLAQLGSIGVQAGGFMLGSVAVNSTPYVAGLPGIVRGGLLMVASAALRGKTQGVPRKVLTGAGVAGGVRVLRDLIDLTVGGDVIGRIASGGRGI